jgi:large subunit ribosomal protein L10
MFSRSERNRKIEVLQGMFGSALGIYLTDINRLNVKAMTRLRAEFRKQGLQYVVVKNNLAKIALERAGRTDILPYIDGPIGIVFATADSIAPARVIRDFHRDYRDLLEVKAVYVEGTVLPGSDVARLAMVPGRDVLLGQLLTCLKAPVQKVAGSLHAILSKFVRTVDAVRAKRETESPPAASTQIQSALAEGAQTQSTQTESKQT